MKKQLQKAIDLAAYTGDKIIVVDDKNDHGTVILSLDEYEKIIFGQDDGGDWEENLTDEEMIDKINREITLEKGVENSDESEGLEATQNEDDFLTFGSDLQNSNDDCSEELPPSNLPIDEGENDLDDPDKEENIYYYEEAPVLPVVANDNKEVEKEDDKEDDKEAFTSVGEELRNRHSWDIPKNIKSGAQEVK